MTHQSFCIRNKRFYLLLTVLAAALLLSACAGQEAPVLPKDLSAEPDTSGYLICVEDVPDTVDFQCTTIHYTIALNVFDRLVEMGADENGEMTIVPSLAESYEISDDRLHYTFRLREGITFSNGAALTSSDVGYSLTRLLTHPGSCNQDIAELILGAKQLEEGTADHLQGFQIIDDLCFEITLEEPFEAFLACLTMPGASIMDEDTTKAAGERFGMDPACTIGTGSFIFEEWIPDKGLSLRANPNCWKGEPGCSGLDLRFLSESETVRELFEDGKLDILDLDELGDRAEYFIQGDLYQDYLYQFQQIGITYIALNESKGPLQDVRVRKALQLALNRNTLLAAVHSGRGFIENGIYPHGLYGYNPDLPEIPYDPGTARTLLEEAGLSDGFDLTVSVKASSTQWEMTLMTLAASMWEKIGVHASIKILKEEDFMTLRKSGELECYTATWIADYDDPDNFVTTFFGSRNNTTYRSLCYPDEEIMDRVRKARTIADADRRLQEYQDLEEIIVQEDAAWIPLFSRLRSFVVSERVDNFEAAWNGSVKPLYARVSLKDPQ